MWWRQPGWFSGPLLANPEFRTRFKTRLRELLESEFTPEKMEPVIARVERALEPEIRFRAQFVTSPRPEGGPGAGFGAPQEATAGSPGNSGQALERFRRHIDSFRRQVKFRREFLLKELDQERSP